MYCILITFIWIYSNYIKIYNSFPPCIPSHLNHSVSPNSVSTSSDISASRRSASLCFEHDNVTVSMILLMIRCTQVQPNFEF
jgi:uncharacterized membrane protein